MNFFWNRSKLFQSKYGFPETLRYFDKLSEPKYMKGKDEFETKSGIKVTCIKSSCEEYKIYRFVPKILQDSKELRKTLIYYHGGGMVFGPAKGGFPIAVTRLLKNY